MTAVGRCRVCRGTSRVRPGCIARVEYFNNVGGPGLADLMGPQVKDLQGSIG